MSDHERRRMIDVTHVRHVQIQHRGQTLNVGYRPARLLDPDVQSDIGKAGLTDDTELHVRILARTVVSWDLVRDGRPVDITEDAIMELPAELTAVIRGEIGRDFAASQGWRSKHDD